ncbi:MAG: hypothetical protein WDM96_14005 [Lacunisphaera sp.]
MRLLPDLKLHSPVAARFVPADRFFLRFVPLAADLPPLDQAGLALEGLAPFPPVQLHWGCFVAPDRASALVYAAHRRRFSPGETADWEKADLAVPDLLPLFGSAPAGPALVIRVTDTHLAGVAWPGGAGWPSAVHARALVAPSTEADRAQFAAELAARAKLPDAPATWLTGVPRARREGDRLIFELVDTAGAVISTAATAYTEQDALDVRDRTSLDRRRRDRRRDEFVWKLALAGLQVAALAFLIEVGALAFRGLDHSLHARMAAQAPLVEKLEIAHGLTSRIDDLKHRRLKFFEMLAAINEPRPHSIQFTRTGTSGRSALEIDAQTSSADDVSTYEAALRKLAALEKVEIRDLRSRDGVTVFGLTVAFRAEPAAGNGGAP